MDRPSVPQLPSLSSSLVQAAIQATAQFTPVPALAPVAQLVSNIITLCQNVSQNKATAAQLSTRCHRMLLVINERHTMNENVDAALKSFTKCLGDVQVIMEKCVQLSKLKAFLHQYDISVEIARCHSILSDCFNAFQIASHTELHEWQAQFKESSKQDHRELVGYLGDITNSQTIIYDLLEKIHENTLAERQSQSSDVRHTMEMMQQFLRETKVKDQSHIGLSSNLYDLQLQSRELLPDFNLRSGEVIRSGIFPVSGTSSMDIYEGLYLQREKVAIKVVRAVNAGPDSARRFERECEIWKELWKRDGGKYILPFYGFSQSDGPFPYIVSPWQANGSAIQYVKRHDLSVDYLKLAKGIALGIQILHNMTPPIVHGDIKAMNIAINNLGNPLIADFGLSCIVEDITGIPFSQSRGVSESYRWFAPELCVGQGVLSASSDIYAFGMTVLELFTHEHPYKEVKHTAEVVIKSSQGIQPKRPTSERVLERGLSDALWSLMLTCWNSNPAERPSIGAVIEAFPTH